MRELSDGEHHMVMYEIHETKHSVYLVTDYLPGGELLNVISKSRRLQENSVKKIIKNILKGLEYCHEKRIMHRDLKPENLMLSSLENIHKIKIIDFGLAQFYDRNEYLFKRCGTPGFIAPEILSIDKHSSKYDEKCDIFSLGIIFYILLNGHSPFQSSDIKKILKMNRVCKIDFKTKTLKKVSE